MAAVINGWARERFLNKIAMNCTSVLHIIVCHYCVYKGSTIILLRVNFFFFRSSADMDTAVRILNFFLFWPCYVFRLRVP